jgi:hypothetical protein
MKYLTIITVILLLFGCSEEKKITSAKTVITENVSVIGVWGGTVKATYPGPDDGIITEIDVIIFEFEDNGHYNFGSPDVQRPITASGHYTVEGDTITLTKTSCQYLPQPYKLEGKFSISNNDTVLVISQTLHPELWPETHVVTILPGLPDVVLH